MKLDGGYMKLDVKRKLIFFILLLFCIIILVSPIYLRHLNSDDYLIGDKPYYYLRIANYINETNTPIFSSITDNFSFGGREYAEELGWPYLLSFNSSFLSFYLPIILGILSFILFYLILKILNVGLNYLIKSVCQFLIDKKYKALVLTLKF